jgi:hypothetical protein
MSTVAAIAIPLPGAGRSTIVEPPPGAGPGNWSGAPSSARDERDAIVLAYRVRAANERGIANVIAHAPDGIHFAKLFELDKQRFGAASLQRPAIVRIAADHWLLYVSCALSGKAWRIDVIEADSIAGLATAKPTTAFPSDGRTAYKDPVVRRRGDLWRAWVCCHPLTEPGEEDRMRTDVFDSSDGIAWTRIGTALEGRSLQWDARGARVTSVLENGLATYDGRATKEENFSEQTGIARLVDDRGTLAAIGDTPASPARYLDILELGDDRYRLFYEAPRPDGSHELRTELVMSPGAATFRSGPR